ncbi:hypothetical protein [Sanguibacter sp. HDW7]|uniref:hypothetical protein n=1 Tax=Sanguibacter sp. HDW7 TaxID=2714931 RepID=UPI001407BE12|nr:hypothetical protein [Sanguibacter sp. HDW7]QIK82631.1 hypothetical protein G7063_02605 [Sanguibacter sp. HDW7]
MAAMLVSGAIGLLVWHSGLTGGWDAETVPEVLDPRHMLLAVVSGFLACTPLLAGVLPRTTATLALAATASLALTGQASDRILAAPLVALVVVVLSTAARKRAQRPPTASAFHPGDAHRAPAPRVPLATARQEVQLVVGLGVVAVALVAGGVVWTVTDVPAVRALRAEGVVVRTDIVDVTSGSRRNLTRRAHLVMPDGTRVTLDRASARRGLELEVRWQPGTTHVEETSAPERPTRPLGLSGTGLALALGAGAFVRRAAVARRRDA